MISNITYEFLSKIKIFTLFKTILHNIPSIRVRINNVLIELTQFEKLSI